MATDPPPTPRLMPVGLLVVGSEMAAFTIAGLVVDYFAGSLPWATVGLTLLGCVAAFYHVVLMSKASAAKRDGGG